MSVDELKTALRETLDRRGILGTMRANLQSEIFSAIDSQVPGHQPCLLCSSYDANHVRWRPRQDDARPVLSYENMLMNELIREYLEVVIAILCGGCASRRVSLSCRVFRWQFNQYRHSLSVFLSGASAASVAALAWVGTAMRWWRWR